MAVLYLGGTAVSRFLLKFTLATGLSSTASNTSSGMDPSCFSLRKNGKSSLLNTQIPGLKVVYEDFLLPVV